MNQVFRDRTAETAGRNLAEAGADGEQAITIRKCIFRGRNCSTAEAHPGVQRMVAGKGRETLQGCRNGSTEQVRNFHYEFGNIHCSPADKNPGRMRGTKQFSSSIQFAIERDLLGNWSRENRNVIHVLAEELQVDRNFHQPRPGKAVDRCTIGLKDHRHNLFMA